jgi:uncharacterized membrane protein YkvA (DUF1232 family)
MDVAHPVELSGKVIRYLKDPSVALWRKLSGVVAVAYVVMPFDLVVDLIPIVGWLDDLGVMAGIAWFLVRDIKRHAAATQIRIPPRA